MAVSEKFPVCVVFERCAVDSPWQDFAWQAIGVIPVKNQQDEQAKESASPSRTIFEEAGRARYLTDVFEIELFRKETEGYKVNLSQDQPLVYVVLCPAKEDAEDGEGGAPDMEVFHVTLCPYEAESYTESGDETVDGVPMPEPIHTWAQAFIETHHVDVPFKKRKRNKDKGNQEKGWGAPRQQKAKT